MEMYLHSNRRRGCGGGEKERGDERRFLLVLQEKEQN